MARPMVDARARLLHHRGPMVRREHIGYLLAVLMDGAVMATTFFAVTRRAAEREASAAELGWLGAVFFIVYTVAVPVTGKIADRFGRRRLMVAGLVTTGLLILACSYETRLGVLLALSALAGAGAAMFWPAVIAWLCEGRSGRGLVGVLSAFSVCWNLGLFIGSSTGGILYEVNQALPFFVYGSALVVASLVLLVPHRMTIAGADETPSGVGRPTALFYLRLAWLANLTVLLGLGAVSAMFPQLATRLEISPAVHGHLVAASRAAAIVAFIVMWSTRTWQHRLWPLLLISVVGGAGALMVAVGTHAGWFFAGFVAMGFVSGVGYLTSTFYTLEAFAGRAAGVGWNEAVLGAGLFVGPLAAGFVGDAWGLRAPYFFATGLFAAGLLAQTGLAFATRAGYKADVQMRMNER